MTPQTCLQRALKIKTQYFKILKIKILRPQLPVSIEIRENKFFKKILILMVHYGNLLFFSTSVNYLLILSEFP